MKSLSKLSLLLFTLISVQITYAQTPEWNSIYKTAWTGDFIDFDISKNSEVAAFSENGFLYHSADTGKTWTPVFNCLLEDKSSYLRTSKGLNGEDEYILSYNYDLEFSPDSLQGICYFRYDSLDVKTTFMVLTNDGGKTWKHSSYNFTGKNIKSLYWKTADSAFMVASGNMYVTDNGGDDWTLVQGGFIGVYHLCFFNESEGYAFSNGMTHYKTTNGGQTWETYSDPNLYVDGIHELANGNVLLIGNNDGVINITTDDPRFTFTKIFNYPTTMYGYDVFNVDELDNGDLYVSEGSCYYSSDAGSSWSIIGSWAEFKFVNDQIVLNVGNSLTTRISYNKGQTWETHVYEAGEGLESLHVRSREELYVRSGQNLLHTTDGGETWETIHFNDKLSNMQFVTNDTIYLSGHEVIYRSINAGQTWERFETEANGANIYFITPDIGYLGAKRLTAGGSIIYKTLDAGETWTEADGSANWDWDFGDNNCESRGAFKSTSEGLMEADNGLVHTTNGGDNWDFLSGITGIPYYINNTWIVMDWRNHKIHTCDENINCTTTFTDIETYTVQYQRMLDVHKLDDNTIMVTYDGDMNFMDSVIISRDNGQTWTKEYNPHPNSRITYFDSKTAFGLGTRVIYKKSNKIQTTGSFGLSADEKNINCTVTNELQENFVATIKIVKNGTETITVSSNTNIVNNQEFSVTIPSSITSSDNFVVVIEPNDDTYAKSTSQSFQITGTTTVKTTVEEFAISTDQTTVTCTIANEAQEDFLATVKIVKNGTETITVSTNTTIVNNQEFSITIPSSITKDDSFVVIIEPNDTKYEESTSESFQITDTGTNLNQIEKNKHTITVIGNRIICNCEDFEIYNTIGQMVHKNTELQSGTYIVKCGKTSEKIVVKP
ncbi:MAG: YCF48-related protein [Bacteroidales bacterium]|jgi:photosystem II stability/assembly factor-like uncharacterized protein|nr:YCF48-related protein [Bacteroidales bacterium]